VQPKLGVPAESSKQASGSAGQKPHGVGTWVSASSFTVGDAIVELKGLVEKA
jgi:hypothetical protein